MIVFTGLIKRELLNNESIETEERNQVAQQLVES